MGILFVVGFTAPWVIERLRNRPRLLQIAVAGEMATLLTLGIGNSAERNYTWKSSDTVFRTLASEASASFKAHYALGGMYFEETRPVEGEREWRYAIALMPSYYGVYIDLGHKYRESHVCQAAIPMYKQGLAIEPALPLARVTLVACYLELAEYHRARSEARSAIADGFNRRALLFMIERADSALAANDSLDATNQWTGHSKVLRP
jgi:tetratricopeptide (TPR) repeat protein